MSWSPPGELLSLACDPDNKDDDAAEDDSITHLSLGSDMPGSDTGSSQL